MPSGETLKEFEKRFFKSEVNPYYLPEPQGSLRWAYEDAYTLVDEAHRSQINHGLGGNSDEGALLIVNHGILPRGHRNLVVFCFFEDGFGKFAAFSSGHVTRTQYEGKVTKRKRMLFTRAATQDDLRDLKDILRLPVR